MATVRVKVVATQPGFQGGHRRRTGATFDVPEREVCREWMEVIGEAEEPSKVTDSKAAGKTKQDDGPKTLSDVSKATAKGLGDAMPGAGTG